MTFHYTDTDGDHLYITPTSRHGQPALNFRTERPDGQGGAAVDVPVDQLEDVVAGARDTARQAAATEDARRIRKASVAAFLVDQGYTYSEPGAGDWDPGIRVTQNGPRAVHVFWDGAGEADQLATIIGQLHEAGYHVHATQQERGGRRRLEVTLP
ncbi:hypothetical protein ACIQCF_33260 [Streptomyces sp. NPDC088353]|uniref:hypothetical protein n=1 Tax=Streptomyces sp. NPDC088353 TaxID=3365855 RepID=UPI00381DFE6A